MSETDRSRPCICGICKFHKGAWWHVAMEADGLLTPVGSELWKFCPYCGGALPHYGMGLPVANTPPPPKPHPCKISRGIGRRTREELAH